MARFPIFSRGAGNLDFFHRISPFLNVAKMYKPFCGPPKSVCQSPSVCSLHSQAVCQAASRLSAFTVLFAGNGFFLLLCLTNFCPFKNRLTPHFLSEAFQEPPGRAFPMHPTALYAGFFKGTHVIVSPLSVDNSSISCPVPGGHLAPQVMSSSRSRTSVLCVIVAQAFSPMPEE